MAYRSVQWSPNYTELWLIGRHLPTLLSPDTSACTPTYPDETSGYTPSLPLGLSTKYQQSIRAELGKTWCTYTLTLKVSDINDDT